MRFLLLIILITLPCTCAGGYDLSGLRSRKESKRILAREALLKRKDINRIIKKEIDSEDPFRQKTVISLIPGTKDVKLLKELIPFLESNDSDLTYESRLAIRAFGAKGITEILKYKMNKKALEAVEKEAIINLSERVLKIEVRGFYDFGFKLDWEKKTCKKLIKLDKIIDKMLPELLNYIKKNVRSYGLGYYEANLIYDSFIPKDFLDKLRNGDYEYTIGPTRKKVPTILSLIYKIRMRCLYSSDLDKYELSRILKCEDIYENLFSKMFQRELYISLYKAGDKSYIDSKTSSVSDSEKDDIDKPLLLLRTKQYKESIEEFKRIIMDVDSDEYDSSQLYYDYACALSMLGRTKEALEKLKTSADSGYSHWAWMIIDPDMKNLRETDEFKKWYIDSAPASHANKLKRKAKQK